MCSAIEVVALPAGSRPQLQICSSESLKNSFPSQLPSLFINDCYSGFWITIISSSRSIIFPSLIKTESGTRVPAPGLSVPPSLISRTDMDPAGIYVRSSKSSMFSLWKLLLRVSEIMKFREITTWQELAMQEGVLSVQVAL